MPFPLNIRLDALIACQRQCCLCHERKHTRMQCHHIIPEADKGPDSFDNCIPLCPDCHAEVMAFNSKHPFGGTPYHSSELKRRRDDWYTVIQRKSQELSINLHHISSSYPYSKSLQGKASFNYSNHDGFYRLGEGNCEFLTHWSKGSDTTIHCYRDSTNVEVALVPQDLQMQDIKDASLLNFSSRFRSPRIGQVVVLENHASRYAVMKILKILDDSRGHSEDLLVFDYWILEDGSDDFSAIA